MIRKSCYDQDNEQDGQQVEVLIDQLFDARSEFAEQGGDERKSAADG